MPAVRHSGREHDLLIARQLYLNRDVSQVRDGNAPGFPGVIAFQPLTVQPNTWTLVEFNVSPTSPDLFYEGGTYAGIFGNVSRIQIGASVPAALAGVDQDFTFELDQVTVNIPEPTALAMSVLGLIGVIVRRRNRV